VAAELIAGNGPLADLVRRFGAAGAVAVDTEFMRRDTFFPHAGLIQLCFDTEPDDAWLIDPLSIDDFEPLRILFRNRNATKVLHSASEDLEVFRHLLGEQPRPLFDTQLGAALAGLGFGMSYRALVERLTGRDLEKDARRSDWLARPLTASQLRYAASDVVPLLSVYRRLERRLAALGRSEWVLEDGARAAELAAGEGEAPHLRIKSAWKLAPRQLASLILITAWRERRARSLDKPRNWILKDGLCHEIARRAPDSESCLRAIPEFPPAVLRKHGGELLRLVGEAARLPESELPARLAPPLNPAQRRVLKDLKRSAADRAEGWGVEAAALLPARDYELMVRLAGGEKLERPPSWSGWRREALVEPLMQLAAKGATR